MNLIQFVILPNLPLKRRERQELNEMLGFVQVSTCKGRDLDGVIKSTLC